MFFVVCFVRRLCCKLISAQQNYSSTTTTNTLYVCVLLFTAQRILAQPSLGSTIDNPALSCEEIANNVCNAPSDYYWIKSSSDNTAAPLRYYCDMMMQGGGWLLLFERNTNDSCPTGLVKDSTTGFCKSGCTAATCSPALTTPEMSPFDFREVRGQVRLSYSKQKKQNVIFVRCHSSSFGNRTRVMDSASMSVHVILMDCKFVPTPRQVNSLRSLSKLFLFYKVWSFVVGYGFAGPGADSACPCGSTANGYASSPTRAVCVFLNELLISFHSILLIKKNKIKSADSHKMLFDPYWTCDQRSNESSAWFKLFDSSTYCGPQSDVAGGQWFQKTLVSKSKFISVTLTLLVLFFFFFF